MPQEPRTFTLDELAGCDGKDGRPAYVAHKGRVLDVSASKLWKSGRHMNRHDAGLDLTADLAQAPHQEDVLARCPQVGVVAGACAAARGGVRDQELPWLLRKSPFLRRHPHPMTVHFPLAFGLGAAAFLGLFLVFGGALCEHGALAMLLAGAVTTPLAILTGLATWKYNYGASLILPVLVKLCLSPVVMAQFLVASAWWLMDPAVLTAGGPSREIFSWVVFSLVPTIGVVGWFGATLTFPAHD
jgi:predicted heme/steroid binding protein/uncharacterized membrane protein